MASRENFNLAGSPVTYLRWTDLIVVFVLFFAFLIGYDQGGLKIGFYSGVVVLTLFLIIRWRIKLYKQKKASQKYRENSYYPPGEKKSLSK